MLAMLIFTNAARIDANGFSETLFFFCIPFQRPISCRRRRTFKSVIKLRFSKSIYLSDFTMLTVFMYNNAELIEGFVFFFSLSQIDHSSHRRGTFKSKKNSIAVSHVFLQISQC